MHSMTAVALGDRDTHQPDHGRFDGALPVQLVCKWLYPAHWMSQSSF